MPDYQSNSRKSREAREEKKDVPPKVIEKVIIGEVIVKKKSLGRKFKDLIIEADFNSVSRYIFFDVLVPAAKNMVVDSVTEGAKRMVYGESAMRRRVGPGQRFTMYNSVFRPNRDVEDRFNRSIIGAQAREVGPRRVAQSRHDRGDYIIPSREEAALVLERMIDVIERYDHVTVADLNELVGFPSKYVDNDWGWVYLNDVQVRQTHEGYLLDLPPAEPISEK